MTLNHEPVLAAIVLVVTTMFCVQAHAQRISPAPTESHVVPGRIAGSESQLGTTPNASLVSTSRPAASAPPALFDLSDSDVKFKLESLMSTLRDSRHESWVLAAYPDPKTSRPLIGAGFSLDVPATEHPQSDPLNPHTFLEPSSEQLWQAAGLDPAKLQTILERYDRDLKTWKKKNFRRKIKTHQLSPELTDEDATSLLLISVTQAVYNARAYCREFDQLTRSQQMAISQLVFQMGVNLQEFVQFLSVLNDTSYRESPTTGNPVMAENEHWKAAQTALIQSDWARRYRTRAISVIAMFDPDYEQHPAQAELQVQAVLRPPVIHHGKKAHPKSLSAANGTKHGHKAARAQAPG